MSTCYSKMKMYEERVVKRAVAVAVSVSVICFSCRDELREIYIAVGHFRDTYIVKCRESSRHMQSMSRMISTYINGVEDYPDIAALLNHMSR